MQPIRCACLVAERNGRLLLVRVRDNEHWYLPGGKIEQDESPEETLERELAEELGIAVDPESVRYLYTVRGPAYGHASEVELVCFAAHWKNEPSPLGEISEVGWLHCREHEKLAPAVRILCEKFLG